MTYPKPRRGIININDLKDKNIKKKILLVKIYVDNSALIYTLTAEIIGSQVQT